MDWKVMGYISLHKDTTLKYTKINMQLLIKGGFSSKSRIESLIELGSEARTHRPSPSSSI